MSQDTSPAYLAGQHLSDYDFELPPERIAQFPLEDRTAARLLCATVDEMRDMVFSDVASLLRAGDLLVMNNTRVIKARLRGRKETGGAVEAMTERVTGEFTAISMLRASKTPKPGCRLYFEAPDGTSECAVVGGRQNEFFELTFEHPVLEVLERCGRVPLPPYIEREADRRDEDLYQTVYARDPGAVAAPTAGLHFTEELLAKLSAMGVEQAFVTLHVGAGTFQPVREEDLTRHHMHSEWCTVPQETADAVNRAQREGRRVVCVGSTSVRTLEAVAVAPGVVAAGPRETTLFIAPGYRFRITDVMITNFHLPKSTLVMMVSAILGRERLLEVYRHAVDAGYRFFSYGDACFFEVPEQARARLGS